LTLFILHVECTARFRAGIAQLVERDLAKVEVASSNLVSRSNFFLRNSLIRITLALQSVSNVLRRNGRMAMQRIANPWISVRLRVPPPVFWKALIIKTCVARVVKLVDTRDLKSLASNGVPVQVRPRAPFLYKIVVLQRFYV
jgi:hypothetical protein